MLPIYTIQQAADKVFVSTGSKFSKDELLYRIHLSGWASSKPDGIKLLATNPNWISEGVGELPRIDPNKNICNSVLTDGLIEIHDGVIQSIIKLGQASLTMCTGIDGAPFINIDNLRITDDEIERFIDLIKPINTPKGKANTKKPSILIWWQQEYDILEKAKSAYISLSGKEKKASIRAVANRIAADIEIAEKANKRNRKISGDTIRNTALKGWKYSPD